METRNINACKSAKYSQICDLFLTNNPKSKFADDWKGPAVPTGRLKTLTSHVHSVLSALLKFLGSVYIASLREWGETGWTVARP